MRRLIAFALFALCFAANGKDEIRYITLQPTFVTNYGYTERGRLKYLKADVSVRVADLEAETAVKEHFPYLRNNIVLLLSRQDEATVSTSEGREKMRLEAMEELRGILEQETGKPYIEDLMFSNFVVQH